MTDLNKQRYDLYLDTPVIGRIKAAEVVLAETRGQLIKMAFRYFEEYRQQPNAFALDPVQLPLRAGEFNIPCAGGIPGILDDYLPDDWGRKVLAQLAFYQDQQRLNQHSAIEILSRLGNSRVGALQWIKTGGNPDYGLGCKMQHLSSAEIAAQLVDAPNNYTEHLDEMSLLYLASAGTGVGGARPKALIHADGNAYLAKFNRHSLDPYNNARVELACLQMARAANLDVGLGHIQTGINQREVLLLDRFDVIKTEASKYSRKHLISINALLKNPQTQQDRGGAFRYDDIAELLRQFSVDIESDLKQLLRLMLFNRAINNTDTHERNFSLINDGSGYRLSPAYDLVPSLVTGCYPVAAYQYTPFPPKPSEIATKGKIFGLPKTAVKNIAEEVITAIEQWPEHASKCGVSDEDKDCIQQILSY